MPLMCITKSQLHLPEVNKKMQQISLSYAIKLIYLAGDLCVCPSMRTKRGLWKKENKRRINRLELYLEYRKFTINCEVCGIRQMTLVHVLSLTKFII